MPEKDGYQVLEEMRLNELLYHVPAIVITADDSAGSKVRVFELGASDIIAKPFDPNVVISRVKNIIELGRYRRRLETLVEERRPGSGIQRRRDRYAVLRHRAPQPGIRPAYPPYPAVYQNPARGCGGQLSGVRSG